jgi:hypothetical protein
MRRFLQFIEYDFTFVFGLSIAQSLMDHLELPGRRIGAIIRTASGAYRGITSCTAIKYQLLLRLLRYARCTSKQSFNSMQLDEQM